MRPHLRVVSPPAEPGGVTARPTIEALYRDQSRYVAWLVARVMGRRDDVEDVVQEVFIKAARQLHRLENPDVVVNWLSTIAVRTASRALRRRRLWNLLGLEGDAAEQESVVSPEATPEQKALLGQIYKVLDTLPANQRVAWALRYLEGEELARIGELCGCSLAAVKRRITAAQGALRKVIGNV